MKKEKFDYGNFRIEYRHEKNSALIFLKKKIDDLDSALKEADKLKNLGYHDVMIKLT